MGAFTVGDIVIAPFPFTDLTNSKIRPAVIVADLEGDDYILAFITSTMPHGVRCAIELTGKNVQNGTLKNGSSYMHPSKLFTAHKNILKKKICELSSDKKKELLQEIRNIFR